MLGCVGLFKVRLGVVALVCVRLCLVGLDSLTLGCLKLGCFGLCLVVLGHIRFVRVGLFYDRLRWVVLGYGSLGWCMLA